MVRLRLMRMGKKKQHGYRLCAFDSRAPRGGSALENLGSYDPLTKDEVKRFALKNDRILHWLSKGAQPTEAVASILRRQKISWPSVCGSTSSSCSPRSSVTCWAPLSRAGPGPRASWRPTL